MRKLATLSLVLVGAVALSASAATIELGVNWGTTSGDQIVDPGEQIWYDVFVVVDPAGSGVSFPGNGNLGLGAVVFDLVSPQMTAKGYAFNEIFTALAGFDYLGNGPKNIRDAQYLPVADAPTGTTGYGGGWGFDNEGLPAGGTTTNIGRIQAAGVTGNLLGWLGDLRPDVPGAQTKTRLGVGIGLAVAGADDPVLPAGFLGGTGVEFGNSPVPGDGTWTIFNGTLDTSGWDKQKYDVNFNITGARIYPVGPDYNAVSPTQLASDLVGGIGDTAGQGFSFTIIPEPATLGLLLVGGLSLIRRRR